MNYPSCVPPSANLHLRLTRSLKRNHIALENFTKREKKRKLFRERERPTTAFTCKITAREHELRFEYFMVMYYTVYTYCTCIFFLNKYFPLLKWSVQQEENLSRFPQFGTGKPLGLYHDDALVILNRVARKLSRFLTIKSRITFWLCNHCCQDLAAGVDRFNWLFRDDDEKIAEYEWSIPFFSYIRWKQPSGI